MLTFKFLFLMLIEKKYLTRLFKTNSGEYPESTANLLNFSSRKFTTLGFFLLLKENNIFVTCERTKFKKTFSQNYRKKHKYLYYP